MKKIFIFILIFILIISVTMICASADTAHELNNPHGYPYYVEYDCQDVASQLKVVIYSENKAVISGQPSNGVALTGGYTLEYYYTGGGWHTQFDSNGTINIGSPYGYVKTITGGNYDVAGYTVPTGTIEYPIDGETYTESKEIWFSLDGIDFEDVHVMISYTGQNGVVSSYNVPMGYASLNTELGYYIIPTDNIPWGNGSNLIRLFEGIDLLDSATVTITPTGSQGDTGTPSCYLMGVEEGGSYAMPPSISLVMTKYPNTVGLYVNGEKYQEYPGTTGIYDIYYYYQNNITLGDNTLRLTDMVTNEDIAVYNFVILRGEVWEDGNYHYNTEDPTGQGIFPYHPTSSGNIFTDFLTSLGTFGDQLAGGLNTLTEMFTSIGVFLSMLFNAIPPAISVGLFALFSVTVVFAIIRVVRG